MKVDHLWTSYFPHLKGRASEKVKGYYWVKLKPFFGTLNHTLITEENTKAYMRERLKEVKIGTIWSELLLLRTVLNFGVRKRLIEREYDVWMPPKPPPNHRRITREQARALVDACQSPHVRLFIIILLTTACRASAALELTWDRVDFDKGLVELADITQDNRHRKGRAVVPMNRTLRTALLEAKARAQSPYVVERAGDRIRNGANAFKRAAAKAGVPWCSPHVLRHTAASQMVESGIDIRKVSQYLGHSDSIITERVYAKYAPGYLKDAAEALEL